MWQLFENWRWRAENKPSLTELILYGKKYMFLLFFMDILTGQSFWSTKMENLTGGEGNPDPFLRVDAPVYKRRIING
jgi:hypothetical protein